MRKILNPWVHVEGYNCFGCSPDNPKGARMSFYDETPDDLYGDIISVWQPTQEHQSWINTLHGGMQATLLDEVCGWVVFKKMNTSGVTARMDLRYKHTVPTNQGPLLLKARLKSNNHRIAVVEGELCTLKGEILTQCECTYFAFGEEKAKEMGFVPAELDKEEVDFLDIAK